MMPSEIARIAPGRYALRLDRRERELLGDLPGQVRALIVADDPSVRRMFPPAYAEDAAAEDAYRELVRDDLVQGRLAAFRVVEETVRAETIDEEQLAAWIGSLNDVRLVLGTQLDVTEEVYDEPIDETDPRAPALALFAWLGWLLEQAVQAAAEDLPARDG